jgi:hypothetical protein
LSVFTGFAHLRGKAFVVDMQSQWFTSYGSAVKPTGPSNDQTTPRMNSQNSGQLSRQAGEQMSDPMGGQFGGAPSPDLAATRELAVRADTLLKRLCEVEEALTDQEWWLMGRAMQEARVLAELSSLLSVARGELETFLTEAGARPQGADSAAQRKEQDDVFDLMGDPMWMSGSREKAIALLRMCAAQIPPMRQYANVLQVNAERMHMSAVLLDPLGIAAERLGEAEELLRQPRV